MLLTAQFAAARKNLYVVTKTGGLYVNSSSASSELGYIIVYSVDSVTTIDGCFYGNECKYIS